MNQKFPSFLVLIVLAITFGNSCIFIVKETEKAVKLHFGSIAEADIPPGIHFKWPMADKVHKFDARILTLDAEPKSFLTREKKRLIVDSFAKWKIKDVEVYYKATGGDEAVAHSRLGDRVNDGLRNQFGTRTLHEVVSGERDVLMHNLTEELNKTVTATLGVEVVDVRVKRIDLPSEVSEQVFRRMKAEREKEARELRSIGKEAAEEIRADADRQETIIVANAYKESEQLRGAGDADATAIYSAAYSKDPEFYSFTRSLKAYKSAFSSKGDIMLVEPDSEFFRYLKNSKGQSKK
ncbi:HflC protein [Gammaproteobacteria bacterium 50_400_T64]|nr:HflC protein [Gammaproteobacteria bacterium 50_400_T64]